MYSELSGHPHNPLFNAGFQSIPLYAQLQAATKLPFVFFSVWIGREINLRCAFSLHPQPQIPECEPLNAGTGTRAGICLLASPAKDVLLLVFFLQEGLGFTSFFYFLLISSLAFSSFFLPAQGLICSFASVLMWDLRLLTGKFPSQLMRVTKVCINVLRTTVFRCLT